MNTQNYATATVEPDVTELWAAKIKTLSSMVMRIARGDDDLYQEGILGIRDGLLRDPHATDSYLLQGARFAMSNYRNSGKSIDNGSRYGTTKKLLDGTVKTYRKNMRPIYIDHLMRDFQMEYPESSYSPEILALDEVCAEKFYGLLDMTEAAFVDASIQTLGTRNHHSAAMKQIGVERPQYDRLRWSTRRKFIRGFGTDEDVDQLDQLEHEEDMYR